ncbi:hypothetical protein CC85DRAFT_311569 [Cutaneotrichosporon oleaginosum]|uniref:Uncharacterized protein n=1 Tax=Cutaneotrichosporon oleaginosum TaxID=879819 RepID=A0A0J1B7Q2_9TREE|nr:uncharacterized protein CC85DRAFT_311569 [Cutaneotrichosporon oleaginosum]KLT43789.1 hypothetical protein CC85DRAFT_311569 [Cutaneotrichosporon oleaginosum]TXT05204.1 hypothetical protein COLE_06524 [Cutaneotrichosporon oleaginosum]
MLATLPRAAPRAARRLTTSHALRSPLAPTYNHSVRPALAPPYNHPLAHVPESDRLKAPYAFSLLKEHISEPIGPTPTEWVSGLLETKAGREWVEAAWDAALKDLAEQPAPTQVSFQHLGEHLAESVNAKALQRSGSLVIRDVLRDPVAEAWASELTEVLVARSHSPTYYTDAQIAARADPSVLSATGQALKAFVPTSSPESAFVRIDAAAVAPAPPTWLGTELWGVDDTASPATPVHAHLALARTEIKVPTSASAATYALLRPFFAPKKSRISFYTPTGYTEAANWALRGGKPELDAELVHVRPATVSLAPGDVLVTHAGLRLQAADAAGLLLPVHPLPATEGNRAYVALQRASFEAGLPPPHVPADGTPIALEEGGDVTMIESWGGRRALGYGF